MDKNWIVYTWIFSFFFNLALSIKSSGKITAGSLLSCSVLGPLFLPIMLLGVVVSLADEIVFWRKE